jgi:hypothetical protein
MSKAVWLGKRARKKNWNNKKGETVDGKWSYEMQLSISRAEELNKCIRKWFLKKIVKCKIPYTAATQFGTAIHQVNERYYLDQEMYPETWWQVYDDYGQHAGDLDLEEQRQLKQLVQKAIDDGVLFRHPDGIPEWKFEDEIVEGAFFEGSIDYAYDFTIVDHKSVSDFDKPWVKIADTGSNRWLGKDKQMLVYAYYWCRYQESLGKEIPETIELIHNQFNKETGEVRKVTAEVSFIACQSAYQSTQKSAMKMINHKRLYKAESWLMVPTCDRRARFSPCNYCKYSDLCDGNETVEDYKNRILENEKDQKERKEVKDKSMSFKGFANKSGATKDQEAVLKQAKEDIAGDTNKEEAPVVEENRTLEQVKSDIESFLEVCKANEMEPAGKKWDALQAELAPLQEAEDKRLAEEAAKKAAAEKAEKEKADASKKEAPPKEEKTEEPEVKTESNETEGSSVEKIESDKHFGKKEPIICVNCQPLGLPKNLKLIQTLVKQFTDAIGASQNTCYYKLDTWERRAQLRHDIIAAYEAGTFNQFTIVCNGPSPDEQEAVNALLSTGIYGYVG